LISVPALLLLEPASSVVPVSLVGMPESGAYCWAPLSIWTSEAGGSC
jgi:hypothetical protein